MLKILLKRICEYHLLARFKFKYCLVEVNTADRENQTEVEQIPSDGGNRKSL